MKLDKIIVLLLFKDGSKGYLRFKSRKECSKYFKDYKNIEELSNILHYEIYYASLFERG